LALLKTLEAIFQIWGRLLKTTWNVA
jgi:hypothetical protein